MESHVNEGEEQVSSSIPDGHISAAFLFKATVPHLYYRM